MKSNIYIARVWDISLKNQPAADYLKLCQTSLCRAYIDGYTEKHHMLPKSICATKEEQLDRDNLVILSAKEHFIAHKLLSEMFDGRIARKMMYALSVFSLTRNGERILDANDFALAKEASRLAKQGIPLSEEHKQKIRNTYAVHNPNKGRVVSDETRIKQSNAKKGKPHAHSEETRKKLSTARIGLIIDDVTCPHCNKIGKPGALGRWHFNNCKARRN